MFHHGVKNPEDVSSFYYQDQELGLEHFGTLWPSLGFHTRPRNQECFGVFHP